MSNNKMIDTYIKAQPKAAQAFLRTIRATIRKAAPNATEAMSYGIPTLDLYGHLVHFAGYEQHIGLYPGPAAIRSFEKELKSYKTSKGAIQFPLTKPLPLGLITKIVASRVEVNLQKAGMLFPKMSAPAARALKNAKIVTLKDLSRWSEKELSMLHGMGPSTIPSLRSALKKSGLSFKKAGM
ncbi:DUF1801 domain-containing protein [Patescibacteria group bacterium]|nr:DUF1801 domain-containing protein [Patescibacteria group bacterium]